MEIQKHIRCAPGDVGEYVFIPGDQGRAGRIAEKMDHVELISENRAYLVYTGELCGVAVSVCATGIGGPSASIAIEELARVGAKYLIRVGSAGGRQETTPIGSLIIVSSAYRGEGTTLGYAPLGFPAVADIEVTNALIQASDVLGEKPIIGMAYTRDAYYKQDPELNALLTEYHVEAAEMECSVAFVLGSIRELKIGAILATDSNIWLEEQPTLAEKERLFQIGEKKAIDVAVEAMKILIQRHKHG
jgi:uridine phosphorylase